MSGMIERVAKAIDECPEWPAKTYRERMARAAIEAMREPTPEMVETGHANIAPWWSCAMQYTEDYANTRKAAHSAFRGMIDAALSPSPQPVEGD
ncbi:hypothetical protein [Mesorhizobium sp.]|uniref:hypothetical protein n=1 Tax=Mesorhizobium sp. TaxID=1871066 RepID=UPI000FE2E6BA|nr:hypothetical protein [Mesorhizobium sp.]RWK39219.1 MAG: hypothetical protein EOR40_04195 [Mesorhizobium sp.]